MEKKTLRGAFSEEILKKAKEDKSIYVVCTDSRGSASLGSYPEELPGQFVEMGIAEQNSVTVSAGLASTGKKVFAIGPASFYSMRSAEQVKVDMAYSQNNVKIIGISGGISYGALGATHHSVQDITLMRAIPDMIVEIPSDASQMVGLTDALLQTETPAYIRVGRGAVPVIYEEGTPVTIGKACRHDFCADSEKADIAVMACGQMVWRAIEAAKLLQEKGINSRVYDMHTIKPIDREAVLEAAEECGCILTVEENSVYGGLGGAVAEIVVQEKPVPMAIVGIPDENVPNGTDDEVFSYYHMDPAGIADRAAALLKKTVF